MELIITKADGERKIFEFEDFEKNIKKYIKEHGLKERDSVIVCETQTLDECTLGDIFNI